MYYFFPVNTAIKKCITIFSMFSPFNKTSLRHFQTALELKSNLLHSSKRKQTLPIYFEFLPPDLWHDAAKFPQSR